MKPKYNARLHWPKEEIANGLLTFFFNRNVHPIALKYKRYRETTDLEMHLYSSWFKQFADALTQQVRLVSNTKQSYCINEVFYRQGNEEVNPVNAFKMPDLRVAFCVLAVGGIILPFLFLLSISYLKSSYKACKP